MDKNPLEEWIYKKTSGMGIKAYQLEKIRETLRLVNGSSAFYKRLYEGFDIEAVASFENFADLPFVTAEDLAENGRQMLCVPQHEIERIVTLETSGTDGKPKRVYFTAEDMELTVDFFDVGMRCLISVRDRFMIILPCKTPGSVGDLLQQGTKRIGCEVFPYGLIEDYSKATRFIFDNQVTSLVGSPVQILKLAETIKTSGLDIKLNSVLLSTDFVPDAIVKRLERLLRCKVFEHYGMTEMCFGGGVFCGNLSGYHMREADLYFEIISKDGDALPDGEYGEVVFTTLTRKGMPLVRYRTGDCGMIKKERCKCSAELILMDKIRRRADDGIIIGGKEFYISDFDEMLFSNEKVVDYSIEFRDGKLSIGIETVNDTVNAGEGQERLHKRKIIRPIKENKK